MAESESSSLKKYNSEWILQSSDTIRQEEIIVLSKDLTTKLDGLLQTRTKQQTLKDLFQANGQVDPKQHVLNLKKEIRTIDQALRELIQRKSKEQNNNHILQLICEEIMSLTEKLRLIQENLQIFELTLKDITEGVKIFDDASKNITKTMVLLTRLQIFGIDVFNKNAGYKNWMCLPLAKSLLKSIHCL